MALMGQSHRPWKLKAQAKAPDPDRPIREAEFNSGTTPAWVLTKEEGMSDDRTKADKAWEARQEAARYRIFDTATNAAKATDEADDENYFAVSFPKIISGRIDDVVRPRTGNGDNGADRWIARRMGASFCRDANAYALDCNRPHKRKEHAVGAHRQR